MTLGRSFYDNPTENIAANPEESYGLLDVLGAAISQGSSTGTSSVLGTYATLYRLSNKPSENLTVEQLNKEYGQYGLSFEEPQNREYAEYLKERRLAQDRRMQIIQKGATNWYSKALSFGGMIIGAATDPIDLGLGILTGFGVSAALKATQLTGKLLTASKVVANIGTSVGENVANELIYAEEQKKLGYDYSTADGLKNVIMGTIAFSGAMYGGSQLFKKMYRMGEQQVTRAMGLVEESMAANKQISVGDVLDTVERHYGVDEMVHKNLNDIFPADVANELTEGITNTKQLGQRMDDLLEAGKITKEDAEFFLTKMESDGKARKYFDPVNDEGADAAVIEDLNRVVEEAPEYGRIPDLEEAAEIELQEGQKWLQPDADDVEYQQAREVNTRVQKDIDDGIINDPEIVKEYNDIKTRVKQAGADARRVYKELAACITKAG